MDYPNLAQRKSVLIEKYQDRVRFQVEVQYEDDPGGDHLVFWTIRQVLAFYPWLVAVLPLDPNELFTMRFVVGLTTTEIETVLD